ncbi:uncharacterized protein LOC131949093 [Physella acuta]|uniref:uncharacterized protein LOC131949093 n=1 Tax=Physella acuta TaxID=109671 RepID=UPI0027DD020E|nr:uncharacterized protein LOC131949093 [Physella acuta]
MPRQSEGVSVKVCFRGTDRYVTVPDNINVQQFKSMILFTLPKDETPDDFGVCLKFCDGEVRLLGDDEKFGDLLVRCKKITFISRKGETKPSASTSQDIRSPSKVKQQNKLGSSWFDNLPSSTQTKEITEKDAALLSLCIEHHWRQILIQLDFTAAEIDNEFYNSEFNVSDTITKLLIRWHQKHTRKANYLAFVDVLKRFEKLGSSVPWEKLQVAMLGEAS